MPEPAAGIRYEADPDFLEHTRREQSEHLELPWSSLLITPYLCSCRSKDGWHIVFIELGDVPWATATRELGWLAYPSW